MESLLPVKSETVRKKGCYEKTEKKCRKYLTK